MRELYSSRKRHRELTITPEGILMNYREFTVHPEDKPGVIATINVTKSDVIIRTLEVRLIEGALEQYDDWHICMATLLVNETPFTCECSKPDSYLLWRVHDTS